MTTKRNDNTESDEDWQPVQARKPAKPSAVYSIRFTGTELAGLRSIARLERIRISDIVHRAIDLYLTTDETLTIRAGWSSANKLHTYYYSAKPPAPTEALKGSSNINFIDA